MKNHYLKSSPLLITGILLSLFVVFGNSPSASAQVVATRAQAEAKQRATEVSLTNAESLLISTEAKDIAECYGAERFRGAAVQLKNARALYVQGTTELTLRQAYPQSITFFQSAQENAEVARASLINAVRRGNFFHSALMQCQYGTRTGMATSLMISVATDKAEYVVGEAPRVTITATNLTNQRITLDFPSNCQQGVALDWMQMIPTRCQSIFGQVVIEPNASYSWTVFYDAGIGPGAHSLTGWVRGYGNASTMVRFYR